VILGDLGYIARERGELEASQAYYEQALTIHREIQDRSEEGAGVSQLGQIALARGQLDEAEQYFQQSLTIRREVQDSQGEGIDLAYLATVAENREHYDEAETYYRTALILAREAEDVSDIASMSSALGQLLILHRNHCDEGCQLLAETIRIREELGLPGADAARETARWLGCA
jgi:tetratricopeptide (TPR) repeat protein